MKAKPESGDFGYCPRIDDVCLARAIREGELQVAERHLEGIADRKNSIIGIVNGLFSRVIGQENPYGAHLNLARGKRDKLAGDLGISCVTDRCVLLEIQEREAVYGR